MSYTDALAKSMRATLEASMSKVFEEAYDVWGGAERIDDLVAKELLVPVFTGKRLENLMRRVNAIMDRQEDLPLDNIWRVELRENDRVKLTDFTMPSSGSTMNKTIPITDAPKFIRDGLAVLQISHDAGQVDGVGKRVSDTVYYIVERVDGGDTREKGERCS